MSDMSFIREELNAMYEVRSRFMELEQQIKKSETYPTEQIQELQKSINELSKNILPLIDSKLYEEFESRKRILNDELNRISENILKEIKRNETVLDSIITFLNTTFGSCDNDESGSNNPLNPPKPQVDLPPKGFFFGGLK